MRMIPAQQIDPDLEEAPFEMANLSPDETGLPFVVWISPRGGARHDVRVKVTRSARWTPPIATVALRPQPHLVEGEMSTADLAILSEWLALNTEPLVAFWNGDIEYTNHVLSRLKKRPM